VTIEEALAACEATVRRYDLDRFFAALFAPVSRRPLLFALYAFNYEVARIGEQSREPMMGAIRLQWWRETIEQAREGRPRAHSVAIGLAEIFSRTAPAEDLFGLLLDAREFDIASDTFADIGELEAYCDATSSGLMRVAALILGGDRSGEVFLRQAGMAYAMAGLLRAIPFHAARRKLYLPIGLLTAEGLSPDDVFEGRNVEALNRVALRLSDVARGHIKSARATRRERPDGVAALPAASASLYLKQIGKRGFNPLRDPVDVPLYRRQLALLRAAMTGRL
jgi:phytoene synthase